MAGSPGLSFPPQFSTVRGLDQAASPFGAAAVSPCVLSLFRPRRGPNPRGGKDPGEVLQATWGDHCYQA